VRLDKATQIDLIGYGLASFRQDYSDKFVTWSHRGRVRIICPDPDWPSAECSLTDQRDREEGHPIGKTKSDIRALEEELRHLPNLNRSNFMVRRMRAVPSINILKVDDEIFWGPYLFQQQSRNSPTLLTSRGGYLFEQISKHFDTLWESEFVVPVELGEN
jgi:hypothetical protein